MLKTNGKTIGELFREAVQTYGPNDLLVLPSDAGRAYDTDGRTITYAEAGQLVDQYIKALQDAGYGHGHRVALLLENRPEILLMKLALNTLGISWVPVNPDYRPAEAAYLLQDSHADLAITADTRLDLMQAALEESGRDLALYVFENANPVFPPAPRPVPNSGPVTPETEASLLYTSGTTGRPKGCMLSHGYELEIGEWYMNLGGALDIEIGKERIYNPLPLFHINAAICLFFGMVVSGNCHIVPDRFSRTAWWRDIRETRATGFHYLGVVIPVLMNEPVAEGEKVHNIKFGMGAGVEPSLHRPFEERFNIPLIEVWGMTEMCRVLADVQEPRKIDTRAMGRPVPGLEVRVVDGEDNDVPTGEAGELLVRHSAETPRKGFFSGYLNLPEATEEAWRGGWFHTGDTVSQDEEGVVYFVDRKKNIIRRSGENIAAAEIEACLQAHDDVAQIAVLAIQDEMRDEEVFAAIVPNGNDRSAEKARQLFDYAYERLAYYKAPGWVYFLDELPVTGTQKIQKHMIFGEDQDPREMADVYDMRPLKKR